VTGTTGARGQTATAQAHYHSYVHQGRGNGEGWRVEWGGPAGRGEPEDVQVEAWGRTLAAPVKFEPSSRTAEERHAAKTQRQAA
jgi:hypothetical protein